ncbi:MAG: hypothetical protein PHQ00_03200 [Phycisphaerae bacterium]|nr:hypothetical protein [Phycisphaerae bacterium]
MENINIKKGLPEYQVYIAQATDKNNEIDWNKLVNLLCIDGDWTKQGAKTLVELVQNYGSFILKNAFVLAIATKTEDGKLGL